MCGEPRQAANQKGKAMDKEFSSGLGKVFALVGVAVGINIIILARSPGRSGEPTEEPIKATVPAVTTKAVTIDNPLLSSKDAQVSELEREVFQLKDDLGRLRERVESLEDFRFSKRPKETPEK